MKLQSPDEFEKLLHDAMQLDVGQTEGCQTDEEFLDQLKLRLANVHAPPRQLAARRNAFWMEGVYRGLAATAAAIILCVALNVLPPLLVKASFTGTDLIQEKIVEASVEQQLLWQRLLITLQTKTGSSR